LSTRAGKLSGGDAKDAPEAVTFTFPNGCR
jgi:hypothetical protein